MVEPFGKQPDIKELNMFLPYDLVIPLLGIYLKEMTICTPHKSLLQKCS